ncbi:MAG: RIO1 family regulatory kinase/ATPase [Chloroflexota bacterium]|jgi:RIO kinase 1
MKITSTDNFDEFDYLESHILNQDRHYRRQQKRRFRPKVDPAEVRAEFTDIDDDIHDFVPSYAAALDPLHFERRWIIESVASFYHDNLITDVTSIVKGGKEANVYCCLATPETGLEWIAAKLYRPRMLRHLRNDAAYKEGRLVLDHDGKEVRGGREARAMRKKTRFGQHLDFMTWIVHEFQVQQELFGAGADVPRPISHRGNTILMEFIGDERIAAPTLNEITLEKAEAQPLFDRIMDNVKLMLSRHYVHGDLSAYNILFWEGQVFIIDFPQLVDVRSNRNSLAFLERDIRRVCEYFERLGVESDPVSLTNELWQDYMAGP